MDYVYLWADGIHVNIRLEEHRLCLLVMIGVRADGRKELVALTDGYRESVESWADLLRDCARRGMRTPVLAIGDGALGFWGALRQVFPETREQRCWFHKISNVLGALPRSAHPGAKKAMAEIWNAEDRAHALDAVRTFETAYGAKFPKATAKITDDLDELLAFYDYPAEHWIPLTHHQPHRIYVRDGQASDQGHQGAGITRVRSRHGVQAHPGRPGPLARGQRTPPGRPRPRRRRVLQRQARRTPRHPHRRRHCPGHRSSRPSGRLKDLHPQILTIALLGVAAHQHHCCPHQHIGVLGVPTMMRAPTLSAETWMLSSARTSLRRAGGSDLPS